MRYEDLRLNPEPALKQLFEFMLEADLQGTVLEARIKQVCATSHTSKSTYKLKLSHSDDLSRNRNLYTEEMITYLKKHMPYYIYYFGYADVDQQSQTNFFNFHNNHNE